MRSVWLARSVRTESATEYNRVVLVTFVRLLTLVLTYLPLCAVAVADVAPGVVPDPARRLVGHLLWLQSVLSPFVTLQDNDFRDKLMVPRHAAGLEAGGAAATSKNGVGRHHHHHHRHRHGGRNGKDPGSGGGGEGGGGAGGEGGVTPDIGSSGGPDGEEHRARNIEEMKAESRRQLQRGLSFITSSDMRTIRGSTE